MTARTGRVVGRAHGHRGWELILVSQSGIVMRTTVDSIAKVGALTQGVHVMNRPQGDRVASVATIDIDKPAAAGNAAAATNGASATNGRRPPPGRSRRR